LILLVEVYSLIVNAEYSRLDYLKNLQRVDQRHQRIQIDLCRQILRPLRWSVAWHH